MTYIQPIFTPDCRYRVKQNFKSGPTSIFNAGEVVVFERNAYSHYDNCFVYVFRAESNGETKEWWLLEGQSGELWREYFELLCG
jgi:hypothetical protein